MLGELYHREISVLAHHTNLDSAAGGLAEQWIKILGLEGKTWPLAPRSLPQFKVVTFVPSSHRDELLEAIFRAGGGKIGNYRECSFLLSERALFDLKRALILFGKSGRERRSRRGESGSKRGREFLSQVIESIFSSHPYEQPVVDVYPLFPLRGYRSGKDNHYFFSPSPRGG